MRVPVVGLRKPSDAAVSAFLDAQRDLPLTWNGERDGYRFDSYCVMLGQGNGVFERAVAAMRRWEGFRLGWVELCWPDTPIREGAVIGVRARSYGLWTINACRIVRVHDEPDIFGFAHCSLPGHIARGEESFYVERNGDGDVWFRLEAISRPSHPLARLGYALTRRAQRRFAKGALEAMATAVQQLRPQATNGSGQ